MWVALLDEGCRLKSRVCSHITNGKLDELYVRGLSAGALGGKLLGAGGGGFMVFFCDPARQDAVRAALNLRQLPVRISTGGSEVLFADWRRHVRRIARTCVAHPAEPVSLLPRNESSAQARLRSATSRVIDLDLAVQRVARRVDHRAPNLMQHHSGRFIPAQPLMRSWH